MEIRLKKRIIIVAGEPSGDLHAANLVKAIKSINPQTEFFGLGGKKMEEAGVEVLFNLANLAVVGFVEVLKNLKKIKLAFRLILEKADQVLPDAAILVDYPGFNLRLAKELKKRNIKIIYYISPQIWAWGIKRVKTIKQVVDKMLVVFKFEEELYKKFAIDSLFIGHPLLDAVKPQTSRDDFLRDNGLAAGKLTIGLMPGSRSREVEQLLAIMLESAEIIKKDFPDSQFIVIKSGAVRQSFFEAPVNKFGLAFKIIENQPYECINACDFVIVASGTATLETAILSKPMVIIYKVSLLTWLFLKFMLKIPYVGLVNVVAGRKIVPECLQFRATPAIIAAETKKILAHPEKINQIKLDLEKVRKSLGNEGASQRAAEAIIEIIS